MKLKSVAGITYLVKNIDVTTKFYESLGFLKGKHEKGYISFRLNWFWLDFYEQKNFKNQESGQAVSISVEDVDDFYKAVLAMGYKPETEPADINGNREFFLYDPDGYKLVFFKRK